jgi:hypothetical protein
MAFWLATCRKLLRCGETLLCRRAVLLTAVPLRAADTRLDARAGLARIFGLHPLPAMPGAHRVRHTDQASLNDKVSSGRMDDAARQMWMPKQRAGAHGISSGTLRVRQRGRALSRMGNTHTVRAVSHAWDDRCPRVIKAYKSVGH